MNLGLDIEDGTFCSFICSRAFYPELQAAKNAISSKIEYKYNALKLRILWLFYDVDYGHFGMA